MAITTTTTTTRIKIILLLIVSILIQNVTGGTEKESKDEELLESETKDGKLEIIKQIKRINDDGSYTIGYEADDGTFKIESRDVLGNIKGTYGYIDETGQIKRVSYSTSNTSDVTIKPTTVPTTTTSSVVQRIPKVNRTLLTSTKRPVYSTTSRSNKLKNNLSLTTPITTSTTTTTTTQSTITDKIDDYSKPTQIIYATSSPRILLQSKPLVRSTTTTSSSNVQIQKSEGQLIRPDIVTELPLFKRLALKHPILNDPTIKPVVEDEQQQQIRNNILRRQLSQERTDFDPQQHVFTLQQSLGNDVTDVYSASVTAGTPRPLFTTTTRPRGALLSSTSTPVVINRPNRYQQQDDNNYGQETTTEPTLASSSTTTTTTTPVPVVQIPPVNQPTSEPLVAIRHPFQRGTILVPLSQVQNRIVPVNDDNVDDGERNVAKSPIFIRRSPPPPPVQFRPIPVHVDENGFIREVPAQQQAYPLPVPVTPQPIPQQRYVNYNVNDDDDNDDDDDDNGIEKISPPVSTRDFQKLLQQLIVRQSRLERISELTNPRKRPELYHPRYRPVVYRPTPVPYYAQRVPAEQQQQRPEQRFINEQQFVIPRQSQQQQQQQQRYPDERSYIPTRRVARLLQPGHEQQQQQDLSQEYLPPDIREMLLLRMLQLAINPALPLNEDDFMENSTPVPQYKKVPVRNVEILGEENDHNNNNNDDDNDHDNDGERTARTKRYKQTNFY